MVSEVVAVLHQYRLLACILKVGKKQASDNLIVCYAKNSMHIPDRKKNFYIDRFKSSTSTSYALNGKLKQLILHFLPVIPVPLFAAHFSQLFAAHFIQPAYANINRKQSK